MNATEKNGNLHRLKGELKQKFASLTENDQMFKEGEKQEMFGKHLMWLGKTKEVLQKLIVTL